MNENTFHFNFDEPYLILTNEVIEQRIKDLSPKLEKFQSELQKVAKEFKEGSKKESYFYSQYVQLSHDLQIPDFFESDLIAWYNQLKENPSAPLAISDLLAKYKQNLLRKMEKAKGKEKKTEIKPEETKIKKKSKPKKSEIKPEETKVETKTKEKPKEKQLNKITFKTITDFEYNQIKNYILEKRKSLTEQQKADLYIDLESWTKDMNIYFELIEFPSYINQAVRQIEQKNREGTLLLDYTILQKELTSIQPLGIIVGKKLSEKQIKDIYLQEATKSALLSPKSKENLEKAEKDTYLKEKRKEIYDNFNFKQMDNIMEIFDPKYQVFEIVKADAGDKDNVVLTIEYKTRADSEDLRKIFLGLFDGIELTKDTELFKSTEKEERDIYIFRVSILIIFKLTKPEILKKIEKIAIPNIYKIERLGDQAYQINYKERKILIRRKSNGLRLQIISEGFKIEEFTLPKKRKNQKFEEDRIFTPIELKELLLERKINEEALDIIFILLGFEIPKSKEIIISKLEEKKNKNDLYLGRKVNQIIIPEEYIKRNKLVHPFFTLKDEVIEDNLNLTENLKKYTWEDLHIMDEKEKFNPIPQENMDYAFNLNLMYNKGSPLRKIGEILKRNDIINANTMLLEYTILMLDEKQEIGVLVQEKLTYDEFILKYSSKMKKEVKKEEIKEQKEFEIGDILEYNDIKNWLVGEALIIDIKEGTRKEPILYLNIPIISDSIKSIFKQNSTYLKLKKIGTSSIEEWEKKYYTKKIGSEDEIIKWIMKDIEDYLSKSLKIDLNLDNINKYIGIYFQNAYYKRLYHIEKGFIIQAKVFKEFENKYKRNYDEWIKDEWDAMLLYLSYMDLEKEISIPFFNFAVDEYDHYLFLKQISNQKDIKPMPKSVLKQFNKEDFENRLNDILKEEYEDYIQYGKLIEINNGFEKLREDEKKHYNAFMDYNKALPEKRKTLKKVIEEKEKKEKPKKKKEEQSIAERIEECNKSLDEVLKIEYLKNVNLINNYRNMLYNSKTKELQTMKLVQIPSYYILSEKSFMQLKPNLLNSILEKAKINNPHRDYYENPDALNDLNERIEMVLGNDFAFKIGQEGNLLFEIGQNKIKPLVEKIFDYYEIEVPNAIGFIGSGVHSSKDLKYPYLAFAFIAIEKSNEIIGILIFDLYGMVSIKGLNADFENLTQDEFNRIYLRKQTTIRDKDRLKIKAKILSHLRIESEKFKVLEGVEREVLIDYLEKEFIYLDESLIKEKLFNIIKELKAEQLIGEKKIGSKIYYFIIKKEVTSVINISEEKRSEFDVLKNHLEIQFYNLFQRLREVKLKEKKDKDLFEFYSLIEENHVALFYGLTLTYFKQHQNIAKLTDFQRDELESTFYPQIQDFMDEWKKESKEKEQSISSKEEMELIQKNIIDDLRIRMNKIQEKTKKVLILKNEVHEESTADVLYNIAVPIIYLESQKAFSPNKFLNFDQSTHFIEAKSKLDEFRKNDEEEYHRFIDDIINAINSIILHSESKKEKKEPEKKEKERLKEKKEVLLDIKYINSNLFDIIINSFDKKKWESWNNGKGLLHKSGAILFGDKNTIETYFEIKEINGGFVSININNIQNDLKQDNQIIKINELYFKTKYIKEMFDYLQISNSDIKAYLNKPKEFLLLLNDKFGCIIYPYYPEESEKVKEKEPEKVEKEKEKEIIKFSTEFMPINQESCKLAEKNYPQYLGQKRELIDSVIELKKNPNYDKEKVKEIGSKLVEINLELGFLEEAYNKCQEKGFIKQTPSIKVSEFALDKIYETLGLNMDELKDFAEIYNQKDLKLTSKDMELISKIKNILNQNEHNETLLDVLLKEYNLIPYGLTSHQRFEFIFKTEERRKLNEKNLENLYLNLLKIDNEFPREMGINIDYERFQRKFLTDTKISLDNQIDGILIETDNSQTVFIKDATIYAKSITDKKDFEKEYLAYSEHLFHPNERFLMLYFDFTDSNLYVVEKKLKDEKDIKSVIISKVLYKFESNLDSYLPFIQQITNNDDFLRNILFILNKKEDYNNKIKYIGFLFLKQFSQKDQLTKHSLQLNLIEFFKEPLNLLNISDSHEFKDQIFSFDNYFKEASNKLKLQDKLGLFCEKLIQDMNDFYSRIILAPNSTINTFMGKNVNIITIPKQFISEQQYSTYAIWQLFKPDLNKTFLTDSEIKDFFETHFRYDINEGIIDRNLYYHYLRISTTRIMDKLKELDQKLLGKAKFTILSIMEAYKGSIRSEYLGILIGEQLSYQDFIAKYLPKLHWNEIQIINELQPKYAEEELEQTTNIFRNDLKNAVKNPEILNNLDKFKLNLDESNIQNIRIESGDLRVKIIGKVLDKTISLQKPIYFSKENNKRIMDLIRYNDNYINTIDVFEYIAELMKTYQIRVFSNPNNEILFGDEIILKSDLASEEGINLFFGYNPNLSDPTQRRISANTAIGRLTIHFNENFDNLINEYIKFAEKVTTNAPRSFQNDVIALKQDANSSGIYNIFVDLKHQIDFNNNIVEIKKVYDLYLRKIKDFRKIIDEYWETINDYVKTISDLAKKKVYEN